MRCVEWSLGSRDLAYTVCIRETPHHFDIFAFGMSFISSEHAQSLMYYMQKP